MSKIVHYQCDLCRKTYTTEPTLGPITIEIIRGGNSCYKRWSIFAYQEHVCSSCLEKLELAINELVNNFN